MLMMVFDVGGYGYGDGILGVIFLGLFHGVERMPSSSALVFQVRA